MDYTTNLNLKKPSGAVDGDFINVADINGNMDDIDAAIGDHIADTDNPHAVTKAQVGLGNCDNTSDANKPISVATQGALTPIQTHVNTTNIHVKITSGTAAPTGGADGDVYFQYE